MNSGMHKELDNVASETYVHLTTNGRRTGKSHTVELWFALAGDRIYLSHEGEETEWMKNVKKDATVRFEIGGREFAGNARLLEDHSEEAWTGEVALYEKYYGKAAKDVIEDWFSLSRLVAVELA